MGNYLRIILSGLLLIGVVGISMPVALCQEEAVVEEIPVEQATVEETEAPADEAQGKIAAVDLENLTLVIKELKDAENQIYEDVTILISNSTLIDRDFETISLDELAVGDEAKIKYTVNDMGEKVATSVWATPEQTENIKE